MSDTTLAQASTTPLDIVILAAGKGTRMQSDKPKVLHTLAGKSFLQHVIDSAQQLQPHSLNVVVGHRSEQVLEAVADQAVTCVKQAEQLGTGHAVQQALPHLNDNSVVLVLYGDVPLTSVATLQQLVDNVSAEQMALLTVHLDNPQGYGRIVRNNEDEVQAIVEQKDATEEQLSICEINTGILAIHNQHLQQWLPQLSNQNASGEYYLTDLIAMAVANGVDVIASQPSNEMEVLGVNNRLQQAQLERYYQRAQAEQLLQQGVTIMDPARFDCRGTLRVGQDTLIDVGCVFIGECQLGNNVTIEPHCVIENAIIGDNVVIKSHSVLEKVSVGDNAAVGPFSRLRPGTELKQGARIGNFVEVKKATIGEQSKVNHLSYIGDATVGSHCNIGAGAITCNYDGVNKFHTHIGDDVFVGTNNALIAPVTLASGATTGAGSVITHSVKTDQLAVCRAKQRNIDGWQRPVKKEPS